jgi:hypothetical protein
MPSCPNPGECRWTMVSTPHYPHTHARVHFLVLATLLFPCPRVYFGCAPWYMSRKRVYLSPTPTLLLLLLLFTQNRPKMSKDASLGVASESAPPRPFANAATHANRTQFRASAKRMVKRAQTTSSHQTAASEGVRLKRKLQLTVVQRKPAMQPMGLRRAARCAQWPGAKHHQQIANLLQVPLR